MIQEIARGFLTATAKNLPLRRPLFICFFLSHSGLWPYFLRISIPLPHIPFLRIRPSIRSAFKTTLTLESAMAAEATIGSMRPNAASGTAAML